MRGFSTIEILVAVAILTSAIIAVTFSALGTPLQVLSMSRESDAHVEARTLLGTTRAVATHDFAELSPFASTTSDGLTASLAVTRGEDESVARAQATVSWESPFGGDRTISLQTLLTDVSSTDSTCDPFVSGDWSHPKVIGTYALDFTIPGLGNETYAVSDVTMLGKTLVASIGTTGAAGTSTLLFFDASVPENTPRFLAGFDNSSTSMIGYTSVSVGNGYLYAGNGFGSASKVTCSDMWSCAQVHIFSLSSSDRPVKVGTVSLSTTTKPYAITTSGGSAPTNTLSYYHHFLYLGLQKTLAGDEFNIINVSDPARPVWKGSISIGRSVNSISVRGDTAYVGTDDPSRELVVIDIRDPANPRIIGEWDAPGSTGFGYGTAGTANDTRLRFGRSYAGNADELVLLDISDPSWMRALQSINLGIVFDPESVRDLYTQDFLTFVLTTTRLEIWHADGPDSLSRFGNTLPLPEGYEGVALGCAANRLYIGMRSANGKTGAIQVVSGS